MPIYVYKCSVCGDVTEKLQRSDDPAPDCRDTFGERSHGPMQKQLTAPTKEGIFIVWPYRR